MASEREIFCLTGPLHITVIDWTNAHHRKSILASLVHGVKVLERDRQKNRQGQQALAPPWWRFFNFQLIHELVDPDDKSFFGCIYELKTPHHSYNYLTQNYPKYVVAFRGTLIKARSIFQDFKLDLQFIFNSLQNSSRFRLGLQFVQSIVQKAGAGSIWLAGHSLGSAIALLVGRSMFKMGFNLETYLFNPPFPSLPFEIMFKNEKLKQVARMTTSFITSVAVKVNTLKPKQDEEFLALSEWIPHLFVNPSDPICSGYIEYFKHGETMMTIGGGKDYYASHLLPSAHVTTNISPCKVLKADHGIHQWWSQDVHLEYKRHRFGSFGG